MDDDIAALKAENERFKAIIDILLQENKQLRTNISHLSGNDGKMVNDTSNVAQIDGNVRNVSSYVAMKDGNSPDDSSYHLPEDRNRAINPSRIVPHLRKEMLKSKLPGLNNAAVLLSRFYTQPQNTHKHLASITHMTMSGLAKHIHMLKKRGLIVRSGFQTYMLTQKAISIIEKALQQPGS